MKFIYFEKLIVGNDKNTRLTNHYPNTSCFGVYNDQSLHTRLPLHKHCDSLSFLCSEMVYYILQKMRKLCTLVN